MNSQEADLMQHRNRSVKSVKFQFSEHRTDGRDDRTDDKTVRQGMSGLAKNLGLEDYTIEQK